MGARWLGAFPSAVFPGPEAALEETRALAQKYAGHPRLSIAVNPHSVYTTTPEILAACRDLASELALTLHMHLAETAEETQICLHAHGKRTVACCRSLELLDGPCTLAHVVDSTPDELDLLAHGARCGV
mgnify:CR=1 FL=1